MKMSREARHIKVVVFADGPDADCEDEKWRRFQIVLPEFFYGTIKDFLSNLYKIAEEMDDP